MSEFRSSKRPSPGLHARVWSLEAAGPCAPALMATAVQTVLWLCIDALKQQLLWVMQVGSNMHETAQVCTLAMRVPNVQLGVDSSCTLSHARKQLPERPAPAASASLPGL